MTWLFAVTAVTTVICAAGWGWARFERDYYKDQSDYRWRLYKKVVLQYVVLTEQHVNLLLRRNT